MIVEKFCLYPDRDDVTLTAYIADDSAEIMKGQKRPAIIICPGGAYISCSDREAEPVALRFLAMGYHAFVLRYSVLGQGEQITPMNMKKFMKPNPQITTPAPMLELGRAMLLVRSNANRWLVDEKQIGIAGFSAGGHNCAMYSTFWHTDRVAGALQADPKQLRPAFCVMGYPFIDYVYNCAQNFNPFISKAYQLMYLGYFGTATPTLEQQRENSPNYFVTENNPPTFIWNTSTDSGVNVQHTLSMAQALAEKKVPFELHSYDEADHGLSVANAASAGKKEEINEIVGQWVPRAEQWLRKYVKFPNM